MSERNYYVLCDDNCRFPAMTAEQVLEAIAEATGATPTFVDDAFITKIQESNHEANLTFWKGTQTEFNELEVTAAAYKVGIDSNGKLYFTPYTADDLPDHASRHAAGGADAITPSSIGAANAPTFFSGTLYADNWENKTYSFEDDYPSISYDIWISVAPSATESQYDAFCQSKICGSYQNNIVKAVGTVPTVDIPIIIKAVSK